jgi:uncharacterized membrane protein
MQTDPPDNKKAVLELCFIVVLGLIVLAAFIVALTYDRISARAPLVVMVPLIILIGIQFNHVRQQVGKQELFSNIKSVLTGGDGSFNRVAMFIALMALLLLLIYIAGHYIGISVFMFVLMRWIAREKLLMSLLVSSGVTALTYALFEHVFNIELYRGYLFHLLARTTM